MNPNKTVLLSFDTEEFDVPREHDVPFTLEEGMKVSVEGITTILDILQKHGVKATFFCTGNFAEHAPSIIKRIVDEGHEVACHGVDHWQPKETDPIYSKQIVERVSGCSILGYRQPRMFPVQDAVLLQAGFRYDSSLHPTCIPGRYMHLTDPRTWFKRGELIEVPASVTPWFRLPLFWLSLHNLPQWLYRAMVLRTLKHDGYFVTYFHPWEFYALKEHPEWKLPFIIRNHSGKALADRLDSLIRFLKQKQCSFSTIAAFLDSQQAFS